MSEHFVKVIRVSAVEPHPNADRLSIIPIGGWRAVVGKDQFKVGDLAVYIEPDYVVPTTEPAFAFLKKGDKTTHRLKAIRLRGVLSFGLLIPLPEALADRNEGDNVMSELGVFRYAPPIKTCSANALPLKDAPNTYAPKFDIESLQRYPDALVHGEEVFITEKIHGTNARYTFVDGVFHLGSRNNWLFPEEEHVWRRAANHHPEIEAWCRNNPGHTLYGEVYGSVQSLNYGLNDVRFAAFAACRPDGSWWNLPDLFAQSIPVPPVLYVGPWPRCPEDVFDWREDDSSVPTAPRGHMREGLVIVPVKERIDHYSGGRCAFKLISDRYWESKH